MRCLFVVHDRDFAVHALVERNKSLGSSYTVNVLNLVVEQLHQMLVVAGIKLD